MTSDTCLSVWSETDTFCVAGNMVKSGATFLSRHRAHLQALDLGLVRLPLLVQPDVDTMLLPVLRPGRLALRTPQGMRITAPCTARRRRCKARHLASTTL